MFGARRRFASRLLSMDKYGERINLNYGGRSSHKTICGLMLTVLTFMAVVAFTSLKYQEMVEYEETSFHSLTTKDGLIESGAFSLEDLEFDSIFGVYIKSMNATVRAKQIIYPEFAVFQNNNS